MAIFSFPYFKVTELFAFLNSFPEKIATSQMRYPLVNAGAVTSIQQTAPCRTLPHIFPSRFFHKTFRHAIHNNCTQVLRKELFRLFHMMGLPSIDVPTCKLKSHSPGAFRTGEATSAVCFSGIFINSLENRYTCVFGWSVNGL